MSFLNLKQAELSILLVNNNRIREINREHRNIDKPTDVLSFPQFYSPKEFPKSEEFLLGDIVINPLRTCRKRSKGHEADKEIYELDFELFSELLIHGLLHLIGYDHEKNSYQAGKMRRKEIELLKYLGIKSEG